MSFTLDKCALSQSASPSMPHQRGRTEYTGFSAWLKALVWICPTVLQQRERRCQSLSEVTSLKVNPKCFAAIFSAEFCSSCFRLNQANGQSRHPKHGLLLTETGMTLWNKVFFFLSCYMFVYIFQLPPTFTLCCVIIASYSLAQVGR